MSRPRPSYQSSANFWLIVFGFIIPIAIAIGAAISGTQ
jgi:hypothetical protein